MADAYLIDGYNLIHALGLIDRQLGTVALERSRSRLLDFLKDSFASDSARVTVVFDARLAPAHLPHQQRHHGILMLFAPKTQTADDLIETLIDTNPSPRALIVISNDTRLQQSAQRRGSRWWSHTDLLDFLDERPAFAKSTGSAKPEEKGPETMSPEEKEHWMKEFQALETDPELKEFFDMDRFED